MSLFGIRQVRARSRRVTPGHYRIERLRKNGPLFEDGVRHHPMKGRSPLA